MGLRLQRHLGRVETIDPGLRVGKLVIVERANAQAWVAVCDCGARLTRSTETIRHAIRRGATASCGCLKRSAEYREAAAAKAARHGHAARDPMGRRSPTWNTHQGILQRCTSAGHPSYRDYGARGITVCERWLSFENFLADMGPRPEGTSIDRIDGTKGYEPGNCRWATQIEQARNKRSVRLSFDIAQEIRGRVEHGESQRAVARRTGIDFRQVNTIVKNKTWKETP